MATDDSLVSGSPRKAAENIWWREISSEELYAGWAERWNSGHKFGVFGEAGSMHSRSEMTRGRSQLLRSHTEFGGKLSAMPGEFHCSETRYQADLRQAES